MVDASFRGCYITYIIGFSDPFPKMIRQCLRFQYLRMVEYRRAQIAQRGVDMRLKASIVIPTYNNQEIIAHCLQALINQTADPSTYEIVVVDDGSTDNTPGIIDETSAAAPCLLRYLRQENSGRSKARNAGILAARGDILILLDSDMIVRREFVSAHLAVHQRPGYIGHGPVVNTEEISDPNLKQAKVFDPSRAFFATGNVSIEREKIIEAGLFDEDFIEYGWEDLELGERLRKLGLKKVRVPTAWSYHIQPPLTYKSIPEILQKERERGHTAVLFYRKNPSFSVRMMTLISPVFLAWVRLLTPFHWPERPGAYKLLKKLDQSGRKHLFAFLMTIVRSHAYADGIREKLASEKE